LIQAVVKNRGGTIETYFLDRRPVSCTVSLYNGEGSVKVDAATATVDTVNTTLSGAAARGAFTLSLASAAGVVVGRRYLVGATDSTEPREVVTVKSIASTTATLWAPLHYAHSSGVSFGGTRCTYAVSSSQADVLWWDGYADWTPDSGEVVTEVVDCVLRKIPENLIDETDIRDVLPKAMKILDAEVDMPAALRSARDEFLRRLGGRNRAYCALGADHFRQPCALVFWLQRRYALGDEWMAMMDLMDKELDVLVQKIQSEIPFDNDQDGVTTSQNDGGFTVIKLSRV